MMFTARAVSHDRELSKYKIVFITDRTDLEKQLGDAIHPVGYDVKRADSIAKLKGFLRTRTPDLIMGMVHKFQEGELQQRFPELNDSADILVMVDEAHRSQYKLLGANLQVALPNAVRVAFTGTPIEKTETSFGEYIDKYTMRQSLDDGVTVEIVYEGRTHTGTVTRVEEMNRRFEDVFAQVDEEQRQLILNRYTWRAYLEANEVIRDKAADMLEHYLEHVFPNRFKAQLVTVSRLAAVRYKLALEEALKRKVTAMITLGGNPEDIALLSRMKVEAVFSGTNNDEAFYKPYTNEDEHERVIKSFKLPFDKINDDGVSGEVGIIVVQSMLITGFDAPIEQVMYLDNIIKDHNLLQAIARVNRVAAKKSCGYIVDYVGVTRHLREALALYDEKDLAEILEVVRDSSANLDTLKYFHGQIKNFFQQYDQPHMSDIDACVDVLEDEEVRNDFIAQVRSFNKAMDRVLPDPEALRFVGDLKILAWISQSARNRFRDDKLSLKDASRKIREIVDEFLISKGVNPKIPPLPIFSPEFKAKLGSNKTSRATAKEIEHAIRQHINENAETDPEFYERLAEKLEKVLAEYRDNWDKLAKELEGVLEALKQGRENENNFGLNPRTELPFLALLKRELYGKQDLSELPEAERDLLLSTTIDLLEIIRRETRQPDFWENYAAQKRLKSFLLSQMLTAFKNNRDFIHNRTQVAEKILELASYNRFT